MEFLQAILAFAIVIGVVVVVHEAGHFLAARSVGIRVDRFSIGYPPRLFGRKIGDTDYCISALPLGGYVKMAGMIDESMENPEKITGAPDEFMSKSFPQKAWVISAGVIMNFVLAWVIYTGITLSQGIPHSVPVVGGLTEGFPAEAAGLAEGDSIVSVGSTPITGWEDLTSIIHASPEQPLTIVWDRDGTRMSAEVTPRREMTQVGTEMKEAGLIGITPGLAYEPAGVGDALKAGVVQVVTQIRLGITTVKMLLTREAGVKDLGGPVLIAKWSADTAKEGPLSLILFIAFISVNIGFLNILPIPVLDGGHLLLVTLEAIVRRPIPTKVKMGIQQAGMIGLLLLMVIVLWNDIGRVGLLSKITNLFG
jgi:regulator of sigma E protease